VHDSHPERILPLRRPLAGVVARALGAAHGTAALSAILYCYTALLAYPARLQIGRERQAIVRWPVS